MGDDDDGAALFAAGGLQQRQHLLAGLVVQRAGRFVAQQNFGVFGQRPRNGNALLLAARKLGREIVLALAQADLVQHGVGVQRVAADFRCQLHVFARGQVLHQVIKLEHKADVVPAVGRQPFLVKAADALAVQQNGAGVAGIHAAQHVEHRRLAGARRAEDDAELAFFDGEADMVRRGDARIAHLVIFANVVKHDKGLAPGGLLRHFGLSCGFARLYRLQVVFIIPDLAGKFPYNF